MPDKLITSRRAVVAALSAAGLSTGGATGTTPRSADRTTRSVLDFIPADLHAAIAARRCRDDLSAYFQAAGGARAAAAMNVDGPQQTVFVPNGTYPISRVSLATSSFIGESRAGTIFTAASRGSADDFLFDAMRDGGGRPNFAGGGWVASATIDAKRSGRSCLRTYGGGVQARDLILQNGAVGLAAGLPIWSVFSSVLSRSNDVGFYTFAEKAGDAGTSTSFQSCWAINCKRFGWHVTQLLYSSFLNCVAQDSGEANFFVEGNRNGSPAVYSLQMIGCGTEGSGQPLLLRKCRDMTVLGFRIITPDVNRDFVVLDDFSGSIRDFSAQATPRPGRFSIRVLNHGSGPASILIENSTISFDPREAPAMAIVNSEANGRRWIAASRPI